MCIKSTDNCYNSFEIFDISQQTPALVVGYEEISFSDSVENQGKTFSLNRTISIWYPIDLPTEGISSKNIWDLFKVAINAPITNPEIKKPVVVLSHGFGGSPNQLSWLIKKLIISNYIVIGIEHLDFLEGKPNINHWRRPQDISKALDYFTVQAKISFAANLDKIGIAGFSIGGTTAIWLTGGQSTKLENFVPTAKFIPPATLNEFDGVSSALPSLEKEKMTQNWQDHRIKSAFIMAPAWAWIFNEDTLEKISIPTYVIAADEDQVLVTQNNAEFFASHIPQSIYETIPGEAHHYIFISSPNELKLKQDEFPLFIKCLIEDPASVDRNALQTTIALKALDFFNSTM